MTYQVSGRITYWYLASGNQTLDVPAVPYLTGLRISRDRSFLVGYTPTEVVRVDAQTGAERGRASLAGVVSTDISPAGDELACISGAGRQLTRWALAGDSVTMLSGLPALPQPPALLVYGTDAMYFAGSLGGLLALTSGGDIASFGTNPVADITGFDAGQGRVALGSRDWVRVFSSDSLDGLAPLTAIRSVLAPNPFSGSAGLSFVDNGGCSPGDRMPRAPRLSRCWTPAPWATRQSRRVRSPQSRLRSSRLSPPCGQRQTS